MLPHIYSDDLFMCAGFYVLWHFGLAQDLKHLLIHPQIESVLTVQDECVRSDMCGCKDGNIKLDTMVTASNSHHPPHIVVIAIAALAKDAHDLGYNTLQSLIVCRNNV